MKIAVKSPLLTLLVLIVMALKSALASERPNVLMIVLDDLNDWVGAMYGHPDTVTPHLDRLASQGVMFLDAHATSPLCAPSRAAFLSGMRASTSCYHDARGRFTDFDVLMRNPNLPQFFKQAGYQTFGAGKLFHNNYPEFWDVSLNKGPRMYQANMPKRHGHDIPGIMDWGPLERSEQEMDDYRMAQFAIDKLQREHEQPFFIACGIYLPHLPWYAPKEFFEPFPLESIRLPIENPNELDDLPPVTLSMTSSNQQRLIRDLGREVHREAVQAFLASTHFADAQIGRILAALDASPYADNTIVVLFSDHGNHLTEKHRWHKDTLWRESTRVPLVIRAPGMAGNGVASPRMASLLDIYPTLADLIGVEAPSHLEGRSLRPLLENPLRKWDHAAITNRRPGEASIRTEDWAYIRYADGSEELYNRRHDPREWINLASVPEYAQVKQQLATELEVLEVNRLKQDN
jgi:arylsulfatase A-like enzyme